MKLTLSKQDDSLVLTRLVDLLKSDAISVSTGGSTELNTNSSAGTIKDETCIARQLCEAVNRDLLGKSLEELCAVDSWISIAQDLIAMKDAKARAKLLKSVEDAVNVSGGFLVAKRLTLADIYVATAVQQLKPTSKALNQYASSVVGASPAAPAAKPKKSPEKKAGGGSAGGSKEQGKFVDLPNAEMGKVVVRFPPEASGYLHIGHGKAALLNQYYQQTFKGKLIMRFDDTNPAKESSEFEQVILEDLKMLKIEPDVWTHSSDHFDLMLAKCEELIRAGKAYVDDTDAETMRKQRELREENHRRKQSVDENVRMWREMVAGSAAGQKCAVRAKIDMQANNGCMRDPTIYRCKPEPHVRTGDKYKVYPTYDFTCPIVDSLEGVTHALRTTEYMDRDEQYNWFCDALGLRRPHIYAYSRLNMMNTVMSKRKLTWFVEQGIVDGWDDPRFPTIRGVMRRGMTVEGLKEFIIAQGSSRSVNMMDWDKIWSFNKKVIDPVVPRYTVLAYDDSKPLVTVKVDGQTAWETRQIAKHPKTDCGTKPVLFGPQIRIEQDDAALMRQGDTVTFINWGNMNIDSITRAADGGVVTEVRARLDLANTDYKKTMKVTWLAEKTSDDVIRVVCVHYDHLITKPVVGKDEDWKDFINPQSEHRFVLAGERAMAGLKPGEMMQLQRKGYYICDAAQEASDRTGRTLPAVLISIPDGHVKEQPTAMKKSAATAAAKSAPAAAASPSASKGDALLLTIKGIGDDIRTLKANKADKAQITGRVAELNAAKAEFRATAGKDWTPDLVNQIVVASQSAPAPVAPTTAAAATGLLADSLLLDIKAIGDDIRTLKASKADKATIMERVQAMNAKKVEYKTLSGQEWTPDLVNQVKAPVSAAPQSSTTAGGSASPADQLLLDIKQIGDEIRTLKAEKADKAKVMERVQAMNAKKVEYKSLSGQDWNQDLVNQIKTPAAAVAPSSAAGSVSPADQLLLDIKQIGDEIRTLKADKADKAKVMERVQAMNAKKLEYKTLSGQEWNQDLVNKIAQPSAPATAAAAAVPSPVAAAAPAADQVLLQIKQLGDSIRQMKQAKADKAGH